MAGATETISALVTELDAVLATGQGAGAITASRVRQLLEDLVASIKTPTINPLAYGTITDGGSFGDGLHHQASANGFATLAALQTQFHAASFTATGTGIALSVSNVTGFIYQGLTLGATTGIPAGTTITGQSSGPLGGAGVYFTSQSTTITNAAATASWASTTSDDMAGLMIQAAIHAGAVGGGGEVILANGTYYNIACGLLFPLPSTVLRGFSATLLCSPAIAAGHAGVSILECEGWPMPISGVALYGFDTFSNGGGNSPGSPNLGIYTSGSVAMYHKNCLGSSLKNMIFNNFDEAHYWDQPTGNNYVITISDCTYTCCNKAAVIDQPGAANSFERMTWKNCTFGSGNYAAYINIAGSRGGGFGGGSIEADIFFDNCSFDYSCVAQIWFNGGSSSSDNLGAIHCMGCHFETNVGTTGSGARVLNNGAMSFVCCEIFENGSNPSGFLAPQSASAAQSFIACKAPGFPGYFTGGVPLVMGDLNTYTQGYANLARGIGVPFLTNEDGTGPGGGIGQSNTGNQNQIPSGFTVNFGPNTDLAFEFPSDRDIRITLSTNIVVHDDSTINWATGTVFSFVTLPGITSSFTPSSTTITSSNTGLTFGNATKPRHVYLMKTGVNTWIAYGDMD